jgi:hypothetical protein
MSRAEESINPIRYMGLELACEALSGTTHMRVRLVVGAWSVEVHGRHIAICRIRGQFSVAGVWLLLSDIAK